jgi:Asp-tRNA(Asn)/Glu-tRNA(Gln) amidotransferase A subunit family amidase
MKKKAPNTTTNTGAIYYKDVTELATLVRTKQLSSHEVVQAHLDRIAAVNPKVNAIVTSDPAMGADSATHRISVTRSARSTSTSIPARVPTS